MPCESRPLLRCAFCLTSTITIAQVCSTLRSMDMRIQRRGRIRDTKGYTWRTFAVTIPASDLVAGTNVVQIGGDQALVTSNVNIVLVDVPGGSSVLPGSNNAYPGGGGGTAPPTVAFSASPISITAGKTSTVTWSSTNATSCTAGGGWTGTKASNGTLAVSPTSTTTYTLTCVGAKGASSAASTTVAVSAAPAPVSGACGSANGTQASSAPSANLCSKGTSSSVAGSGPWTWSCGGSNGGTSASCSAPKSGSTAGSGSTPGSGSRLARDLRQPHRLQTRPVLHFSKITKLQLRTRSVSITAGPANGTRGRCGVERGMTGMPTMECRARIRTPQTAPST